MNIFVCIKKVPDTAARIDISQDGKSVNLEGVEFVINPYDEYAIEEALRLKEKVGGEVTAVTVDYSGNDSIIRRVLAMGVDKGILVKSDVGFDGYSTAVILSDVLKQFSFDIIFSGKEAVDSGSSQVPSIMAHILNLPIATVVTKLEINGKNVIAHRQIESREEIREFELPAIITTQKGINEPRYPSLKGIMASKKKPIEKKEVSCGDKRMEIVKMEYPPPRPSGKIVGSGVDAVPKLVKLLKEEAGVL